LPKSRRLSFGISIEPTWNVLYSIKIAKLAEKLGYSNVWVPDGGPAPPYSDSVSTLAAIAAVTDRIKFGSAILNFYTRNPAWIASSFLLLSDLGSHAHKSLQRANLGIGVGADYNVRKFGVVERAGIILQMREAIEAIRELHSGEEVTVRTDSFVIEHVTLAKSKKKIPIHVGTQSPKGLHLAGELADGVILTDRIPTEIRDSMDHIGLGLASASRSRGAIEVTNSVVISIDTNRTKAKNAARATCAYLVAWMEDEKANMHDVDLASKEKISKFIFAGDEASAAKLVDDRMLDLLTVSGNVEDCVAKCREHVRQGIDQIAFCEPFGPNQVRSIEAISERVVPKL
jgi:5,10-methylenetetrahydromethanopterin reductase